MTGNILKSADYIESNWDKLSAEQKENLKSLIPGKLNMSDVGDFFVALDRLNNVILSMIEYDNLAYREKLSGLIESAEKGEGIDMSYEEFKGWLNGMATKAGK